MKSENLQNKQEEVIRKPKKGVAQDNGFINRKQYRLSVKGNRKSRNTSKNEIPEFFLGKVRYVPFFKSQRKKLKGWQKNSIKN